MKSFFNPSPKYAWENSFAYDMINDCGFSNIGKIVIGIPVALVCYMLYPWLVLMVIVFYILDNIIDFFKSAKMFNIFFKK